MSETIIGSYRLLHRIGEGGLGVVWHAEHLTTRRKAAIKVVPPARSANRDLVELCLSEMRAAAATGNNGLVELIECGVDPSGSIFIATESLEGESLAAYLRREGRVEAKLIPPIGWQIACAVAALHARNISHHNLKPDNIFLVPDRSVPCGYVVKILDYGLARLASESLTRALALRDGSPTATVFYMAPEHRALTEIPDARADIYSLGCILFEMACGRPPFSDGSPIEVCAAHSYSTPASPRSLEPKIEPSLEIVIARSLAKRPDERPQSMQQLAEDLVGIVARTFERTHVVTRAQPEPAEHLIQQLAGFAANWMGFSEEAIAKSAVRYAVRMRLSDGATLGEILEQAFNGHPAVKESFIQAISVGETYFFRHPDHFLYLTSTLLPEWLASPDPVLRAWSAGCSTGEEAYTIAASLLACTPTPAGRLIRVLGSDLVQRNVEAAQQGVYPRRKSIRAAGPILYPTFQPVGENTVFVTQPVRALCTFRQQNLLDPPPMEHGPFHLILCRNVLLYFTKEAAKKVCANLASALAPGGVVMFGAVDVGKAPPGLKSIGPPELQIYMRPRSGYLKTLATRPPRSGSISASLDRMVGPEAQNTAPPRRSMEGPIDAQDEPPPSKGRGGVVESTPTLTRIADEARARAEAERAQAKQKAAAPSPTDPVSLHLRALSAIERGERRSAEAILAELLRVAPDYLPGILERALLNLRDGRRQRARSLMREVLRLSSGRRPDEIVVGPEKLPIEFYRESAQVYLMRGD